MSSSVNGIASGFSFLACEGNCTYNGSICFKRGTNWIQQERVVSYLCYITVVAGDKCVKPINFGRIK